MKELTDTERRDVLQMVTEINLIEVKITMHLPNGVDVRVRDELNGNELEEALQVVQRLIEKQLARENALRGMLEAVGKNFDPERDRPVTGQWLYIGVYTR